jgi:hypothetical protein
MLALRSGHYVVNYHDVLGGRQGKVLKNGGTVG